MLAFAFGQITSELLRQHGSLRAWGTASALNSLRMLEGEPDTPVVEQERM